jgi:REP element-mobilizing transposase RayT
VGRPLRIVAKGGIYHVTARGNNGETIFADDADRSLFLARFSLVAERYRWRCWAYCLMSNHYHFLIHLSDGRLSDGLQELNGNYARGFNRRHHREGHLFRNRFGSVLVERDTHLLQACRYVVLNPVRAGLCSKPSDWEWSSHRACVGMAAAPDFLAVREVLELFGLAESRARCERFVEEAPTSAPVSDTVTEV